VSDKRERLTFEDTCCIESLDNYANFRNFMATLNILNSSLL